MTDICDHPLLKLPKYGAGTGLHRVRYLLDSVGIDPAWVSDRAVVVTGSNGKGSTARIASELLGAGGETVGLFTSPHLYRYNERFQIDGVPIGDADLIAAMDAVQRAVLAYRATHDDTIGAFEAQFAVALTYFQRRRVRWMVLEAGIGGRFDPVRLAAAPATALVSLDLEHTELLGETLRDIARDKLDATPPGGKAILGESCLPLADDLLAYAAEKGIALEFVRPDSWRDDGCRDGWQRFAIAGWGDLRSRLVGRHQINNHAVALELCRERLMRSGAWAPSALIDPWRKAVTRVTWPGRLEKVHDAPSVYVDVGHTPEGIATALAGFRALTGGQNAILVTGGSKNKHVREMLALLAPSFDRIICTAAYHNGMAAEQVAAFAAELNPEAEITIRPTIDEAVAFTLPEARRVERPVYVAGGLFLAAEFAVACRGGSPGALRFF